MNLHTLERRSDRKAAAAPPTFRHHALKAIPAVASLPTDHQSAREKARAPQTFSPLIQEFLDECGYSDK